MYLSSLIRIGFKILFISFLMTYQISYAAAWKPFVVYWGGWEGMTYDLNNLPMNVNVVNLAFADINNNYQVDTSVSGYLTNIPKEDGHQLQPAYINWTRFKSYHPHTKIILALGGSTFHQIWTNKLTATTADTIAKNIAAVVNQTYPVYKGIFASAVERIDEVNIDGVDLDVETGGARLSDQVTKNVNLLIKSLRQYLDPGKIITFTGFSVGADPNNDQCTVRGSVHCGEDIGILMQSGNLLDWINVMAYDAGSEYATSKYRVALSHYANYVGENKTILGLDIQPQWDQNNYFRETPEQLAQKALWQKQNNFGGVMFWGVNVTNNPTDEQKYIDAIANML